MRTNLERSVRALRRETALRPVILPLLVGMIFCTVGFSQSTNEARFAEMQAVLASSCLDCHSSGAAEGGLELDRFTDIKQTIAEPEVWWKILKNVRAGVMPPADEPRLTEHQLDAIASFIKKDVFEIQLDDPDPGRLTVRRLNRAEYENTINDLMGTNFDAKLLFPADDSGSGFDNVGDALSFSPLLMSKSLKAARTVVAEAVPTQTKIIPLIAFSGSEFIGEDSKSRQSSLDGKTAQTVSQTLKIDDAGTYQIDLVFEQDGTFDYDPARYLATFFIDGEEVCREECGWNENKKSSYQFRQDWQPGNHELAIKITPLAAESEVVDEARSDDSGVRFDLKQVRIEGPLGTTNLVHPANYERFFARDTPPDSPIERRLYAREVLAKFAARAFRGSVPEDTLDRLVEMAESTYSQPGQSFESGAARAMVAVLTSPRFLFHLETDSVSKSGVSYGPISETALASRLSYFLWSTLPDEELWDLANRGQLREHLTEQIHRMMKDSRSQEFLTNFVGQWLRTRDVSEMTIDPLVVLGLQEEFDELQASVRSWFGQRRRREEMSSEEQQRFARYRELREISDRFDADLRRAMRQETEECMSYIIREDRSLLEVLDADYTFLNEKLAEHYGIEGVKGEEMRRVELPTDSPRGGVLTQASMLLITSNPTRTSPVKRGLFILENLLGTPAPPAPAGVPDLAESANRFGDREPSLRELLSAHREAAICASCHARMDPLGLALENYNALGMWRETDHGNPIQAAGQLISGEAFSNASELKVVLKRNHAEAFYRCITEKMLTYAIGRGLEYGDQHSVDLIVMDLLEHDGRFSVLLNGIIASAPFQKQRFTSP